MTDIDDLLREFRADVPGPSDGAAERILERAKRAGAGAVSTEAVGADVLGRPERPRRERRPGWLRWAVIPVGVAAGVSLLVALAPTGDRLDSAPTLLERAEAAIAPADRIVALSMQVRRTTSMSGVVNPNQTISMRQWTLAGAGRAMQMRILISEGPLNRPPTDEDSTVLTDRSGTIVDERRWKPLFVRARDNYDYPRGGGRGELEIGGQGGKLQGPLTLTERLRDAYTQGGLRPAGRTAGGDLRFVLQMGDADSCSRMEIVLREGSLLPRRIVNTQTTRSCNAGGRPIDREVLMVGNALSLPATAANRRLLQIGDWPTARVVRYNSRGRDGTPIDRVPPVPPLDQG